MRGRVMALWALAWLGSTPVGGPIVGWVGQDVGARWALVIGSLSALLCGILALPALARIDRRSAPGETPAAPPDSRSVLSPSWLAASLSGALPDRLAELDRDRAPAMLVAIHLFRR